MKRLVTVTKEHIKSGQCGLPFSCAVALAITEKFPEYKSVFVGTEYIAFFLDDGNISEISTPARAREFILEFDEGYRHTLKPFKFLLDFDKVYEAPIPA